MSVIRTKHTSDTDKFIRHYAGISNGSNHTVPGVSLHNQPGAIGTLSTTSGIRPVPIKNNHTKLEPISDGVPPTGPITIPQNIVMKRKRGKRKAPAKRRKTSPVRKKSKKPTGRKSSTKTNAGSSGRNRRKLPADVI